MLEIGFIVEGSSLIVEEYVSDNKVRCGYKKCGLTGRISEDIVNMTYTKSDLEAGGTKCRFCNYLDSVKDLLTQDEAWKIMCLNELKWQNGDYNKLVKGLEVAVTTEDSLEAVGIKSKYKLMNNVGDVTVRGFLAKVRGRDNFGIKFYKSDIMAVKCNYCGKVSFTKEPEKFKCPICYSLRQKRAKELEGRKRKLIEKRSDKVFPHIKSKLESIAKSSKLHKQVITIEERNKGYKCVGVDKKGTIVYTLACESCGSLVTANRSNVNLGGCEFCKSRKPWEYGKLKQNHVGEVHNCSMITGQDGINCSIKCCFCGRLRDNVPLFDVLGGNYFCDCSKASIIAEYLDICCDDCFKPIKGVSLKDIISGKEVKCESCGKDLTDTISMELSMLDYKMSLREKIKMANASIQGGTKGRVKLTQPNKEINKDLITESKPLYNGVDGKSYIRCYCKEHNKALLLSQQEVLNYNHEHCFDERHRVVSNVDVDNLKL